MQAPVLAKSPPPADGSSVAGSSQKPARLGQRFEAWVGVLPELEKAIEMDGGTIVVPQRHRRSSAPEDRQRTVRAGFKRLHQLALRGFGLAETQEHLAVELVRRDRRDRQVASVVPRLFETDRVLHVGVDAVGVAAGHGYGGVELMELDFMTPSQSHRAHRLPVDLRQAGRSVGFAEERGGDALGMDQGEELLGRLKDRLGGGRLLPPSPVEEIAVARLDEGRDRFGLRALFRRALELPKMVRGFLHATVLNQRVHLPDCITIGKGVELRGHAPGSGAAVKECQQARGEKDFGRNVSQRRRDNVAAVPRDCQRAHRWQSAAAAAILALAAASPAAAQPALEEVDGFRDDLLTFAAELEQVPGLAAAKAADLAQAVSALSPEQIARLAERAPRRTDWRALPQVLRNLDQLNAARQERLAAKAASLGAPQTPDAELEDFRQDMIFFVGNLRAFTPLDADGGLEERLAGIERQVEDLPAEHLGQLRRMYYRNTPRWLYVLRGALEGDKADFDLIPTIPSLDCDIGCPCDFCDFNCNGDPFCIAARELCELTESACNLGCNTIEGLCTELDTAISDVNSAINDINGFLGDVVTFFDSVVTEILALPTTLGNFFTELGNDLLDLLEEGLNALLELIPDAEELLGLMGLDFDDLLAAADFFVDLVENSDPISLPCPDIGIEIGDFGTVGTPRAEYMCTRGIDWLSEKLYDLIPDDGVASAIKYPAALLYYPIKYFCMCMEAQSQLCFADGQATHRELVATNLDTLMSLVASQTSVDALQADADDIDGDIADAQSEVDEIDEDVGVVSAELAVVGFSIDDFDRIQGEQTEFIESFRDLTQRIRIEENLLLTSFDDAVASFQSPEDFAGFLETVREIVADSIRMNRAAGQPIFNAFQYLARADNLAAEGAFEKAYEDYRRAYREAVKE